ncbi:hypothetical protein AAG747_00285 [Rapidithrix thailandica]|uniref:Uncharacterized protein n=1 Tax=Rapidithrix thailandica TaxID=413964 RepID=A0AAW9S6B9_9BACT
MQVVLRKMITNKYSENIVALLAAALLFSLGYFFFNNFDNWVDIVGMFLMGCSIQAALWAIGVRSEILGNKLDIDYEREIRAFCDDDNGDRGIENPDPSPQPKIEDTARKELEPVAPV